MASRLLPCGLYRFEVLRILKVRESAGEWSDCTGNEELRRRAEAMRRLYVGLIALAGLATGVPAAQAQVTGNAAGFSDPFFQYYGFYLPRQAALAASPPASLVSINALSAARQNTAMTERAGLYDPIGGVGEDEYNPGQAMGKGRPGAQKKRLVASGVTNTNINGQGPRGYYNRTLTYYPSLRAGQSANANLYVGRGGNRAGGGRRGIGLGGGGMPTGMGLPSPMGGMMGGVR
jgi:hypothetical protein